MKNGPAWFEAHLRRILRYAKAWGAIVLLEEADEFLEAVLNRTVFETGKMTSPSLPNPHRRAASH